MGHSSTVIQTLINKLNTIFTIKQLGQLDHFLAIEVKHLYNGSLLLSQGKYIHGLLNQATISSMLLLYLDDSNLLSVHCQWSAVINMTHPEINYSVN